MDKAIRKDKIGEMIEILPNAVLGSNIIDYKLYAHLW